MTKTENKTWTMFDKRTGEVVMTFSSFTRPPLEGIDKYYKMTDDVWFKELPTTYLNYVHGRTETLTQHEADLLQYWWCKHSKTPEQRVGLVIEELLAEYNQKKIKEEAYIRMLSAIVARGFLVEGDEHED